MRGRLCPSVRLAFAHMCRWTIRRRHCLRDGKPQRQYGRHEGPSLGCKSWCKRQQRVVVSASNRTPAPRLTRTFARAGHFLALDAVRYHSRPAPQRKLSRTSGMRTAVARHNHAGLLGLLGMLLVSAPHVAGEMLSPPPSSPMQGKPPWQSLLPHFPPVAGYSTWPHTLRVLPRCLIHRCICAT